MDTKGIVIWVVFAVVFVVGTFLIRRMKGQIDSEGIETTGTITRIVDSSGDPSTIDIDVYAKYRTQDGEEVEGLIVNAPDGLSVGQQVKLRYHPKLTMNAKIVE